MNEVISHLASARLGGAKVHPNDDVNKCQSSNDTIPTALQLSGAIAIEEELIPALIDLQQALAAKSTEFWDVVKTGRTHLQDATPIRLGQEFAGYAGQVEEAIRRAQAARDELLTVPLGGTAVGTGINAHPEYAARACMHLSELTGLQVRETSNHFHAQATLDAAIAAHGGLRAIALGLWKIASDIRFMGMGPRAGLAELALPETQPGSSIMPGKVNPVIVESLTMVVARVIGNDATVAFCQTGSFLELNVMMPVTSQALLESIVLLAASARNFRIRLVEGLKATDRGPKLVEQGLMLATALAPGDRLRRGGRDGQGGASRPGARSGRWRWRRASRRTGWTSSWTRPKHDGAGPGWGSRRRLRGRPRAAGRRPDLSGARPPATIAPMSATRAWDRAAAHPVTSGDRSAPEVACPARRRCRRSTALFTFMRDAELRFDTLRMRIEERAWTARGEELTLIEVGLRHPGEVKILSSVPALATATNYDVWVSDGKTVRTYRRRPQGRDPAAGATGGRGAWRGRRRPSRRLEGVHAP